MENVWNTNECKSADFDEDIYCLCNNLDDVSVVDGKRLNAISDTDVAIDAVDVNAAFDMSKYSSYAGTLLSFRLADTWQHHDGQFTFVKAEMNGCDNSITTYKLV